MSTIDPLDSLEVAPPEAIEDDPLASLEVAPPEATDPLAALEVAPPTGSQADSSPMPPEAEKPSAPWLMSRPVSKEDTFRIATKHGIDPLELKELVPYFGGTTTDSGIAEEAVGFVGRTVGAGVPQFAYKKSQDPKMRAAIDEMNELIKENRSWGRATAELGTSIGSAVLTGGAAAGIGGALGVGASAAKAISTASMIGGGTIAGITDSKEGQEATGALIGTTISGVLLGGGKLIEKSGIIPKAVDKIQRVLGLSGEGTEKFLAENMPVPKIAEEAASRVRMAAPDNAQKLRYITGKIDTSVEGGLDEIAALKKFAPEFASKADAQGEALKALDEESRDFAAYILNKDPGEARFTTDQARELIRTHEARAGSEFVADQYKAFKVTQEAAKLIDEAKEKFIVRSNPDFISRARSFISSARYAFRDIDERLGSTSEVVMDNMTHNYNRYTGVLAQASKPIKELAEEIPNAGLTSEQIVAAVEARDYSNPVIKKIADTFEAFRKKAEDLGVPIKAPQNKGYIPYYTKNPVEAYTAIQQAFEGYPTEKLPKGLDFIYAMNRDKKFSDLVQSMEIMTDAKIESSSQLVAAYQKLTTGIVHGDTENIIAGSILKRGEGQIPELIRETDVPKLMNRWTQSVYRYAYMRDGFNELKALKQVAVAAGDSKSAEYIGRYLQDLSSGARQGTLAAATRQASQKMAIWASKRVAETEGKPLTNAFYKTLRVAPDIFSGGLGMSYPNFLGLSLRALLTNLTQPFLMTMPELGVRYSAPKALRAMGQVVMDLKNPGKSRELLGAMRESLEKDGLIAKQWNTELQDAMREGISSSMPVRTSRKVIDLAVKFAMSGYEKTETINRMMAVRMADSVTADYLSGSIPPAAQAFYKTMGPAYKRALLEAGDNPDKVRKLMRQYIIGKTIFDYNKISMSEYGRFMGPLFSMFSKWPTEVAGAMMEETANKEYKRLAKKWFAPLVSLMILDQVIDVSGVSEPLRNVGVLGQKGLTQMAPAASILPLATGEILSNQPSIKMPVDFVAGLMDIQDNPGKLAKAANNLFMTMAPGAFMVRVIEELSPLDVPFVGKNKEN